MTTIDARGLKHPEPLKRLKESFSTMCSIDDYVDLIIDSDAQLKPIKTYAAMSGCEFEVRRESDFIIIRIKSPCY